MTIEEIQSLIETESLNDNYIPSKGDMVRPLPFISSNKCRWEYGIVTRVFPEGATPECWIKTDTGFHITEYCNYVIPVLNAV
jgi:hypothetical protein